MKLSRKLGERIALETGVSLQWLLANNPKRPPYDRLEAPYTKSTYDEYRANQEFASLALYDHGKPLTDLLGAGFEMWDFLGHFFGLTVDATKKRELRLFMFKLRDSVERIRQELGIYHPTSFLEPHVVAWFFDIGKEFPVQRLADLFWGEMIATYKAGPDLARWLKRRADEGSKTGIDLKFYRGLRSALEGIRKGERPEWIEFAVREIERYDTKSCELSSKLRRVRRGSRR